MINILLIDQEPLFQQAFSRMIAETGRMPAYWNCGE